MPRVLCLKSPQTVWPVYDLLSRKVENFETMVALPLGLDFSDGPDGIAKRVATQVMASDARLRQIQGKPLKSKPFRAARLRSQVNALIARLKRDQITHVLVWNGLKGRRLLVAQTAKALGLQVIYAEVAPIAGKICFDASGVNFNNALPREPQFYLDWAAHTDFDPDLWREPGQRMTARASKTGAAMDQPFDPGENFIFVPLQVPDDSQITDFGGWTKDMANFVQIIARAAAHLPPGWHFKVKEHPSARIRLSDQIAPLTSDRLRLANDMNTLEMMRHCQLVLSVNSSVALQAFYFDKPALLCGQSYFGFAPLAQTAKDEPSLHQMIAAPQNVTFDASARAAFMTYLTQEYFFDGNNALKAPRLAEDEIPRFAKRFGLNLRANAI